MDTEKLPLYFPPLVDAIAHLRKVLSKIQDRDFRAADVGHRVNRMDIAALNVVLDAITLPVDQQRELFIKNLENSPPGTWMKADPSLMAPLIMDGRVALYIDDMDQHWFTLPPRDST